MDVPIISVCISVHNTGKYLARCLDSVISQTFTPLEIILVNNGSTDNSLQVMQEYRDNYPQRRIVIIDQDDRGLAQGRQSGINAATGAYFGFIDADDYVKPDAYERLYDCITKANADIVEGKTERDSQVIASPYSGIKDSKQVLRDHFFYGNTQMMLWLRLYRRELFDKPVLPLTYVNNEDNYAYPCLLFRANTIVYCDYIFHHYSSDNELAVMNLIATRTYSEDKAKHNRLMLLQSVSFIEEYIGPETINKCFKKEFDAYICRVSVNYCTYPFRTMSLMERYRTVCETLNMTDAEFKRYYRASEKPCSKFDKLAKIVGVYGAFQLYEKTHK